MTIGKPSYLDLHCYEFICVQAQCGYVFKEILRRLEGAREVKCPRCDASIDLLESKWNGDLEKAIDVARKLDAPAA